MENVRLTSTGHTSYQKEPAAKNSESARMGFFDPSNYEADSLAGRAKIIQGSTSASKLFNSKISE